MSRLLGGIVILDGELSTIPSGSGWQIQLACLFFSSQFVIYIVVIIVVALVLVIVVVIVILI